VWKITVQPDVVRPYIIQIIHQTRKYPRTGTPGAPLRLRWVVAQVHDAVEIVYFAIMRAYRLQTPFSLMQIVSMFQTFAASRGTQAVCGPILSHSDS
jgi:hypothetical protein